MMVRCVFALVLIVGVGRAEEPVKILTLGDSITKGVRTGVKANETFAAYLQGMLKEKGVKAEVVNVGIGGEDTVGASKRLQRDVIARKPRFVTIMYGTNDSYIDKGKTAPRLMETQFRDNLLALVRGMRDKGIEPILMTEPRWAKGTKDGAGKDPNEPLERFMVICREIAKSEKTALIDHFDHWTKAEKKGVNLFDWTTDGYHPNPRGHREMAEHMLPIILESLKRS